jgi:hypothetical protein
VFGKRDEQFIRNGRAPGRSGDMAGLPTEDLFRESPGIRKGGLGRVPFDKLGDRARINWALPYRRQPQLLEQAGGDDKTDRLNMVQPFEVRVAIEVFGHSAHPEAGQR